ncbi:ABC transporter ATP-binding protein [Saccharomonospora cyanea]|uniref:ABC-type cobalamin/Fe3+-siderophore transport system, ATPase component n=1 Tax=Saccharomonospora cyanea NA-134 TaxID=882082 RepID=H5XEN9_9PSEU|nr:ABC transporter ATP-binding protein [Saccharomonospora cyanea]EHR62518.1 ABC-type cobalamin/Fe3+-siderophore transport system, ATPase component [Saccharomonospora cyanea NA-134]
MTALRLDGVGVAYNGEPVVRDVSVALEQGGWLAVVGPNGAGKSTLLKAIAGLVPHAGSITVHGTPTDTLTRRQRATLVGYAAQSPVLPGKLTVTDYVLLGRTPHLGPLARETAADLDIVRETLDRLDLGALAGRELDTLSGGERQRAVLARVLVQRTRLLLLDEPTSGLDIGHAQALLERLDRLRTEDGITVVTTLHDLTFAAQYADTLLLIDGGEVAVAGSGHEVLTAARLRTHYSAQVEVLTTTTGHPVVAPVRSS